MLKLATVFSGIGAIEHALDRMQIPHEIVFACDNGDVDILSENIPLDLSAIKKELDSLSEIIADIEGVSNDDDLYKIELNNMLRATLIEYDALIEDMHKLNSDSVVEAGLNVLNKVLEQDEVKNIRKKEYTSFFCDISASKQSENRIMRAFMAILECSNDFKKDNALDSLKYTDVIYKSSDDIEWSLLRKELLEAHEILEENSGKKYILRMKDISQRTSMLHEKINSFKILKELGKLKNYREKKIYVDNLYKSHLKQNKVRESYMANYQIDENHFHWNVSFLDGKQYENQVDLFVGGSPCQSFSLVGKQRGLNDTRGTLFYDYARLIKEIHPKVFIYENVKAILSNDCGRTWETMKDVFNDLGYNVYYTIGDKPSVLNSKDYGIPQNRERMFVVGFRKDLELSHPFEFPKPIPLDKKMKDFLIDNAAGRYYLPQKGVAFVTSEKNLTKKYTQIDGEIQLCQKKNQQFNWHGDFVFVEENKDMEKTMEDLKKYFLSEKVRKYVLASGTKNFYSKPETDLDIARPLLTTMHKMHRAGVDNYVHTDGRLRKLTPRECLRLMGFCDSFKIVVSDTSAYQQAGNSIVVDVLMHLMKSILKSYPSLVQ